VSYDHEVVTSTSRRLLLESCLDSFNPHWEVLHVAKVLSSGPTAAALQEIGHTKGRTLHVFPDDSSPYLPIDQTWEEFLASRSKNFRYTLRRKEKALKKAGILEERWYESLADVPDLYECMMSVEANSWKTEAGLAVSDTAHEQRYYQRLLPYLAERGALFANSLQLDGNPIAYHLCYRWGGRVGNLKNSFHEDYEKLSPGSVAIHHAIKRAFETGVEDFDFLGDIQPHKSLWTKQVRQHGNYYLFSSGFRPRLASSLVRVRGVLRTRKNKVSVRGNLR